MGSVDSPHDDAGRERLSSKVVTELRPAGRTAGKGFPRQRALT